jgi:type III secretion protein L
VALAYIVDGTRFKLAAGRSIIKADAFKSLEDARTLLLECENLWKRLQEEQSRAFEAERQRGFEQGLREAQAECAELVARTHAMSTRQLGELGGTIAALVVQAVRRLAPRIGASEWVPELVEQALSEVRAERFLIVRVHPDCREAVAQRLREASKAHSTIEFVEVQTDPHIDPFGCTLESEVSVVRADLDLQLQAIERAMREGMDSRESIS